MRKVISGVVAMVLCAALTVGIGIIHTNVQGRGIVDSFAEDEENISAYDGNNASSLTIWYSDDELEDYLNAIVSTYSSEKNVAVKASYIAESEMLENINAVNLDGDAETVDIYFINSESLEKAFLAGLTETIDDMGIFNEEYFSPTAVGACTYRDKMIAYPVCFETSVLAYNTDYVEGAPRTFDDILDVAADEDTELDENVSAVLKWDVRSLLYNFAFAGSYLEFGGENGDDESILELNSGAIIDAMEYYYNLYQFFSIDINEADYDGTLSEFMDGSVMYSIISSRSIAALEDSDVNYDVAVLPDMNDELTTTALSLTTVAVINPYSSNNSVAKDFIKYICYDNADLLYDYSAYMPCARTDRLSGGRYGTVFEAYNESVSLPKLMSASDYWVYLEISLNKIWSGEDIQETLNSLEERMAE